MENAPYTVSSAPKFKTSQCPCSVFGCLEIDVFEYASIEDEKVNSVQGTVKRNSTALLLIGALVLGGSDIGSQLPQLGLERGDAAGGVLDRLRHGG